MMQYQVFIQNPTDRLFTASVVGLPEVRSNGTTEEEAIASLKGLLMAQFQSGKLVTITVPEGAVNDVDVSSDGSINQSDPWLSNMGLFQDDPTFDEFLAEVEIYRREIDATEINS
jgi:predicted RNase H-like HicB family nuclease